MNPPKLPSYVIIGLFVTVAVALYSIKSRVSVEARNRSVSISAEYDVVESLAAAQGIPVSRALQSLKANGLRSIVLQEETAGELIAEGRLAVRYPARPLGAPTSERVSPVVSGAPEDLARLLRGNGIRYGTFSQAQPQPDGSVELPNLTPGMLRALPLGLDPVAGNHVRQAGLQLIARMGNPIGISKLGVEKTIEWAHEIGASIFLPVGDQVLGRRDAVGTLADALTANKMLYASPEFAKLGGDENMLRTAPQLVVRLHSAQVAELDKMTPADAVERYSKAARERNMRVLLLRPLDFATDKPLDEFSTNFVKKVAKAIEKYGFELKPPHPFQEPSVPRVVFAILGLSLAVPVWYVMRRLFPSFALPVTTLAAIVGLAAYSPHYRSFGALIGAIVFPVLAVVWLGGEKPVNHLWAYVRTSIVSLVGGLAVAGLINGLPYYIRAQEFMGVKLAVFFPIFFAAIYFFMALTDAKKAMASPLTWGALMIAIGLLAALVVMDMRTGNDNPAGVSGTELQFRGLLDTVLFVRPRTKAFLIGFPLLFVGVGMLSRYRKMEGRVSNEALYRFGGWTALALTAGAIGLTDIVNTLCHIHTTFVLSVERIGIAFVLGTIIGTILWWLLSRFMKDDGISEGVSRPTTVGQAVAEATPNVPQGVN